MSEYEKYSKSTEPDNLSAIPEIEMTGSKSIEIIHDEGFTYEGYQVVRGEFFSHIYEPSFTLNSNKVSVNMACIKKLPKTDYVQILVHPEDLKLAVRPCNEDEKDALRWASNGKKRGPKQITCRVFFGKVFSLMGWNPDYRYKLLGKLVQSGDKLLFIFDLTTPEIFQRNNIDGKLSAASRTPSYPSDWKDQFGVPIEKHQRSLQISTFSEYAVFGIQETPRKSTLTSSPEIIPSLEESEVQNNDEHPTLPANTMY